ncbi:MAG: hypothetical protein IKZ88_08895 [Neisseriaceae bacterium]|nr:hypothetical protein [Neisseriaceae bacterium]
MEDNNTQTPSVSEVWAEIKQSVKKEITSFRQTAKERPIATIIFLLLALPVLVGGLYLMFCYYQKTGSIDRFLAWLHGKTLLEKLFDVVVGGSVIFLGGYMVIKQVRLPFPFMLPEKVEQAIIQAPVKVFDCVYYSIKNRFFSNKK